MASSTPNRRVVAAFAALAAASLTLGLGTTASATPGATPTSPTDTVGPQIDQVRAQLTAISRKNERLTEALNQAGEDVKAKKKEAAAARVAADHAAVVYAQARVEIKVVIADQYKSSGLGRTTAILNSTSTQDYLDRLTALRQINDRQTAVAAQLMRARSDAQTSAATAKTLLAAARDHEKALAVQHDAVQQQQDKYSALLDRLTAQQRAAYLASLNPPAPVQQRKAVEKQATAAANSANSGNNSNSSNNSNDSSNNSNNSGSSSNNSSNNSGNSGGSSSGSSNSAPSSPSVKAPSNAAAIAVQYALAQQGKPYVFAASGPDSFDCSGLTAAAWEHAGVSIPHVAALQYNVGTHISQDQLQPGDLVFFYNPIGHVAMYVGNGMIVHAPQPGDVVKVVALSVFGSDYVGATRI